MSTETTLTCRELIEFLDDYVDGRLSEERHSMFERHLSGCVECVDYLDSYQRTVTMTGDIGQLEQAAEDAPPDLVNAIITAQRAR
jgi:anti-sigma factor RsiW